jgi:hypothetical protein
MLRSEQQRAEREGEMRAAREKKAQPSPYWTIKEFAQAFRMSPDRARRLLRDEPGVIIIPGPSGRYVTYLIPDAVVERIRKRFSNP